MPKYTAELTFVDSDGRQYPAKICGYDDKGRLPEKRNAAGDLISPPTLPAGEFPGLPKIFTRGVFRDENGEVQKELAGLVPVREFKFCELEAPREGNAPVKKWRRPVLDLLVQNHAGKHGLEWSFVGGVAFAGHVRSSELGRQKQCWRALGEKPAEDTGPILIA